MLPPPPGVGPGVGTSEWAHTMVVVTGCTFPTPSPSPEPQASEAQREGSCYSAATTRRPAWARKNSTAVSPTNTSDSTNGAPGA